MTESQFIEQNEPHWKELEQLLESTHKDADKLNRLFVKISSDLSYARTFYPNRSVRLYLNNLTQRVFDTMRVKEDRFSFKQIIHFFKHILPQEIYRSRKALLVSLTVFIAAVAIGVVSSSNNEDFPRLILGDRYIDMTEDNIASGDPMAVYKDERKLNMFFGITTNNIRVSFLAFVLGFLGSIGTVVVLLQNGIMLGAFQYFFFSKGLFWTSFLTIWIHGTIEISAIIIAGGAGIVIGNGLLFPKSFKRTTALQVSALRALRLILGAVPLFVIAGLLESYVTRQTGLPTWAKASIIGASFLFVVVMWVVYPLIYRYISSKEDLDYEIIPQHSEERDIQKVSLRSNSEVIADAFLEYRMNLGKNLKNLVLPSLLIFILILFIFLKLIYSVEDSGKYFISFLSFKHGGFFMTKSYLLLTSFILCMVKICLRDETVKLLPVLIFLKKYFIKIFLLVLLVYVPFALIPYSYNLIVFLILSPAFVVIMIENITDEKNDLNKSLINGFKLSFSGWIKYFIIYLILIFFFIMGYLLSTSPVVNIVTDYLKWHQIFETQQFNRLFVDHVVKWVLFTLFLPIAYYLLSNAYHAQRTKVGALDLKKRLLKFGKGSVVFES